MNDSKRTIMIKLRNEEEVSLYERYVKEVIKEEGTLIMNHNRKFFLDHIRKELGIKKK